MSINTYDAGSWTFWKWCITDILLFIINGTAFETKCCSLHALHFHRTTKMFCITCLKQREHCVVKYTVLCKSDGSFGQWKYKTQQRSPISTLPLTINNKGKTRAVNKEDKENFQHCSYGILKRSQCIVYSPNSLNVWGSKIPNLTEGGNENRTEMWSCYFDSYCNDNVKRYKLNVLQGNLPPYILIFSYKSNNNHHAHSWGQFDLIDFIYKN